MNRRMTGRRAVQLHLALLALALPALGVEVTVQNDSFKSGQTAYIVGDFVPGEHAGARLTSPCDGAIVAVQIAWLEGTPGHGPSLEEAIHIYEGSTFPTPGLELERLEAPVLTPGFLNEFRWVDQNQTIPLYVPVVTGQEFYVTLEFANPTNVGAGGASVIRDVDGCQGGKNALFAKPGGWMDFCLFLQGDLVIRAVIDCPEPTGACCLPDGSCEIMTASACAAAGGTYQGDNISCATVECPQPTGACCFGSACLNLTEAECTTAAGTWLGAGTACAPGNKCPTGACCLPDGSCLDDVTGADCTALGGTFQGVGTQCASVNCPQPTGACCLVGGGCLVLTKADCGVIPNSYWAGAGTDCSDKNSNGVPDACEVSPGDLNCDGAVDFDDIDPFVLALAGQVGYWAQYPNCNWLNADCNKDGSVDFDDIDPFVALLAP